MWVNHTGKVGSFSGAPSDYSLHEKANGKKRSDILISFRKKGAG